jgi:integrase
MPRNKNHWHPYSDEELNVLLKLKPKRKAHEEALNWFKLMFRTGGTDLKDFAIMKWRQVNGSDLHIIRAKTAESSDSSQKHIPLEGDILKAFNALPKASGKKKNDLVFDIIAPEATVEETHVAVSNAVQNINNRMNKMLGSDAGFKFTMKRIRPTAAVWIAGTSGVEFASKMLMHSTLTQTSVYLANIPNEKIKDAHSKFMDAIKNLPQRENDR